MQSLSTSGLLSSAIWWLCCVAILGKAGPFCSSLCLCSRGASSTPSPGCHSQRCVQILPRAACGVTPTCLCMLYTCPTWPNTVLRSGCTNLNSHRECVRMPHPLYYLIFLTVANIFIVEWYLIILSVSIASITRENVHLFMWVLELGASLLHNLPSEKGTKNFLQSLISAMV